MHELSYQACHRIAATMDGADEALENKTNVREVTNAEATPEPLESGKERAAKRVDHSLWSVPQIVVYAEEESRHDNSLGRPQPPGEREFFVLTGSAEVAVDDEEQKVSSVVGDDPDSSSKNEDLEKAEVTNGGLVGGRDVERKPPLCRICHVNTATSPILHLGCDCPLDWARAHRICAETKFRFKGSWECEICGEVARNIMPEEIPVNNNQAVQVKISVDNQEQNPVSIPQDWAEIACRFCVIFLFCDLVAFVSLTSLYPRSRWPYITVGCVAFACLLSLSISCVILFCQKLRFRAARKRINAEP